MASIAAAVATAVPAAAQTPVKWTIARADQKPVESGKPFKVVVRGEIDSGWHLYSLTQGPGGPVPTSITVKRGTEFALSGAIDAPPPLKRFDSNFGIETEFYEDAASFVLPVTLAPNAKPGQHALHVIASFQTCNDRLCLPPADEDLSLAVGADPRASSPEAPTAAAEPLPAVVASPPPTASGATAAPPSAVRRTVVDMAAASATERTLSAYVGLAALMGALSLLTPCVFPMVPITVSYFTNRARRTRRDAMAHALIYGLGIVLTFTAVGFTLAVGFGASGLNRFAADPWLNLAVTALFLAFALSLFGVFELALPSRLVNAASRGEKGRGRVAGTLFMALAFTLTSFTCTAPFLGTLLVLASQGQWQWPLAGLLAFSSVFAAPFVLLAAAPHWIASWPRSGTWLLAVKVTMGLLELAAAMKFLSNVDLVWGWGLFTRHVVLASWIVVAIAMVAYLFGLLRIGHSRLGRPGVARSGFGMAAVVLSVWLATGLAGHGLGELEAFLPPADLANGGELTWIVNDYDAAVAQASREHRPIFVDFTGYTCTNCRWMEANLFPQPEVANELGRYVRVRLYTDGQGKIYRKFQAMQRDAFHTVALPYYAAETADGTPTVAFGGLTRNPEEFVAFLKRGAQ